jgi:hypothetical protein
VHRDSLALMRRTLALTVLIFALVGCNSSVEDRARDYRDFVNAGGITGVTYRERIEEWRATASLEELATFEVVTGDLFGLRSAEQSASSHWAQVAEEDSPEWYVYQEAVTAQAKVQYATALAAYEVAQAEYDQVKAAQDVEIAIARKFQDTRDARERKKWEATAINLCSGGYGAEERRLCVENVKRGRHTFRPSEKVLAMDWSTTARSGNWRSANEANVEGRVVSSRRRRAWGLINYYESDRIRYIEQARELERPLGIAWVERSLPSVPGKPDIAAERAKILEQGEAEPDYIWTAEKGNDLATARRAAFELCHEWIDEDEAAASALAKLQDDVHPMAWSLYFERSR